MKLKTACIIIAISITGGCTQYTKAFTSNDYMRPPPLFAYATAKTEILEPNETSVFATDNRGVVLITPDIVQEVHSGKNITYRNYVQDMLIQRSDYLCGKYLDEMFIRVAARQVTLDQIATAASAVGTFASGISQEMNLVTTIANGANATYDKRILQEQMSHLLINRINTNRNSSLTEMRKKINTPVLTYSLSSALQDANNYHQKCSFLDGLTSLTTSSTQKK